jgi:hypothetical protein
MDNQCGPFVFAGQLLTGCILTCDYDGCNRGPPSSTALNHHGLLIASVWSTWLIAAFFQRPLQFSL